MSNKSESQLVPKLRFPEFQAAERWQLAPLRQVATRTKQKNRDERIVRVLTNSAEFGVMDQRDFFDKDIARQGNLESYFVVELGSYVYNPRISTTAPVGPISKNKIGTGVMSPLYTVFKFIDDNNDFYEHYFKTTGWHTYMRQASSTGARHDRMAISSDDFMAMPLPVSTPKEQQKIADCLSSLDELIAAQVCKVDALKTHKNGLMQQLFPREGETQPRLRFPEFRDAGAWKEASFGKILKISSGKGFKASEYSKTGIRLLQIENVGYGVTKWNESTIYLPETYAEEYPELVLRSGDIVLALNRPVTNDELKIAKVQQDEEIALLYQRVGRIEVLNDSLRVDFAFHICRQFIKDFVINKSIGSDQPFISLKDLYAQNLLLPSSFEQQRIADCLTSLDDLITAATQELEALKTRKKGLMQKLFPSLEEEK